MRYQKLLSLVYNTPLLITESGFWSIHRLIEAHVLRAVMAERTGEDNCGEQVALPSMTVENGLAVIPISGAIGRDLDGYQKFSGAVDVADVERDIDEAESNPEVDNVLFDIDSPGGMHNGTPELAARIGAMVKPAYSFSAGTIASAAYYIASASKGIFLTQSAGAGSIGTLITFLDQSKAFEKEGFRVQIVKAGRYKGMGTPGTSLSKDHLELLQSQVNQINDEFKAHVRGNRPDVSDEAMEGQMFVGREAVKAGLVDDVLTRQQIVGMLSRAPAAVA